MLAAVPPANAAPSDELDAIVEEMRRALDAFFKGDPGPVKLLFSRRDDVTLANPFGPTRRGWSEVEDAVEQAAANYRGGGGVALEEVSRYVTPELGYVVQAERVEAKIGGGEERSVVSLRVTMIFRREGASWKLVHRHADPITAARHADSVIQN
jgi:ketosteroid isomerase-like protein